MRAALRALIASLNALSISVGAAHRHRMKLQTQFSCRDLAFFPLLLRARILWMPQHRNAGELGNGFLEQLQSFAGQHRPNGGEPRDVAPRLRQAVNQPKRNRIGHCRQKNDGDGLGGVLGGPGCHSPRA